MIYKGALPKNDSKSELIGTKISSKALIGSYCLVFDNILHALSYPLMSIIKFTSFYYMLIALF